MKIARPLISLLLSVMIAMSVIGIGNSFALDHTIAVSSAVDEDSSATEAEQTVWYYEEVNGRFRRRLWSYTQAKWLTDWEWVN